MQVRRAFVAALAVAALAGLGLTHVRLRHPGSGVELFWQSPGSIAIALQSNGSDDLAPGEHEPALRLAIRAWNEVSGAAAELHEDLASATRARTDWSSDSVHLVYFDEHNSSGYFPPGSGLVAITPVQYFAGGRIADADVLFNGSGYNFTTSGELGAFDVQDVAAHELGHVLGLDHSGVAGATMYPYVSPTVIAHRSVSRDDAGGLRASAPSGAQGTLLGSVRRSSNIAAVPGAQVVARDGDGRTAGAVLSEPDGSFALTGLEPGSYRLFATPLDAPVSSANLGGGRTIVTNFQPIVGALVAVASGSSTDYGTLLVAADATLSLGRNDDELPLRATRGRTTLHVLHGAGLGPFCSLMASDPFVVVSPISWLGSTQVTFSVTVRPDAVPGHVDLELGGGGALSILAGALEITPEDPTVSSVTPSSGQIGGGERVTISGSGFRPGASVALGAQLYSDGAPGGCTVVDGGTITLVTSAVSSSGARDVVVIDESGVEGRAMAGFTYLAAPSIEVVFPACGSDLGGTLVTVSGSNLLAPLTVRIDGVVQRDVTLAAPGLLRFVSEPGLGGGPAVLEVEDGDGDVASAVFQYVERRDPRVALVSPAEGTSAGGTEVTIRGADFSASSTVVFGADPDTGLGGRPAAAVRFIDSQTLIAITPAHSSGSAALLVSSGPTGQATVVPAGFTFRSSSKGGSGGGCSASAAPPANWGELAALAAWLPALALLLAAARARQRWCARAA